MTEQFFTALPFMELWLAKDKRENTQRWVFLFKKMLSYKLSRNIGYIFKFHINLLSFFGVVDVCVNLKLWKELRWPLCSDTFL